MNALLRGLVLRRLARHRLRAVLALVAVALGVAAFLSSAAVGRAIERTSTAVVEAVSGGADLAVDGHGSGVPAGLASAVLAVEGVEGAAPLVTGWLPLGGLVGRRALVVGVDPLLETGVRRRGAATGEGAELRDPLAFLSGRGALLTREFAAELGVAPGDSITVKAVTGPRELALAGFLPPGGAASAAAGRVVVLPVTLARELLGRGDRDDRVDVTIAAGQDAEAVAQRIRSRIEDPTLRVGPPRTSDPSAHDVLGTINIGMRIGAVVALLIGMFLVHHTIAVGVAERRREIGVLRALGATRRQVRGVFLLEALLLGGGGSALGVALGCGLAQGALDGFAANIASTYFPADPPHVEVPWTLAAGALLGGIVVSLVAAGVPASRAAAEPPSDAIRRGPPPEPASRARRALRPALAVAAATAAVVLAGIPRTGTNAAFGTLVLLVVAFVAAAPSALVLGARLLTPVLARLGGIPGRLAADDLARNPLRAALPAAALAFGLALVIQTSGTVQAFADSTLGWLETDVAGDLFVSTGSKVMGVGRHTPFDDSLRDEVAAVPGVERAVGVRFRITPWRDTQIFLLALDMEIYRPMRRITVVDLDADEAVRRLASGDTCLVSENFTRLHDIGPGDLLEIPAPDGPYALEVIGRFRDFSWHRGTVLFDRTVMTGPLHDHLLDELSVKVDPGEEVGAVVARIEERVGEGRDLVVVRASEFREGIGQLLRDFFSLSHAQVAVALAVAFLGVVNSLWIAVVLRRRELGILRAAGATRRQVVTSIVLQAGALGVIGGVLGVAGGAALQWVVLRRVVPADTGWVYPMSFPALEAAALLVLGIACSAAAGVLPARLAASRPLSESLGYE